MDHIEKALTRMRSGFKTGGEEVRHTPGHYAESDEEQESGNAATAQAIQSVKAASQNASRGVLWEDLRKELVWQNLFSARQYCRWMSAATLLLVLYKISPYLALQPLSRNSIGGTGVTGTGVDHGFDTFLIYLPFILWTIAFVLLYSGAMTPALPDQKLELLLNSPKEGIHSEQEIKDAAIRSRDLSKASANRGTLFLWLGIAASRLAPVIIQWIRSGM
jgi:hypothetical protein